MTAGDRVVGFPPCRIEVKLPSKYSDRMMPYSTNLTDAEWETLSPLLSQILPLKKKTRPPSWTQREILNGIFYQLKNGCNWADLPKDLPPYSTVYWHYKQWREQGVIEELMRVLHFAVRERVKKNRNGLH